MDKERFPFRTAPMETHREKGSVQRLYLSMSVVKVRSASAPQQFTVEIPRAARVCVTMCCTASSGYFTWASETEAIVMESNPARRPHWGQ